MQNESLHDVYPYSQRIRNGPSQAAKIAINNMTSSNEGFAV